MIENPINKLEGNINVDSHLTRNEIIVLKEALKADENEVINTTREKLLNFIIKDYGEANKQALGGFNGIMKLQKKLGVKVDGSFGPETFKALIRFQKDNNLEIDGIAGPKTQEKLEFLDKQADDIDSKQNNSNTGSGSPEEQKSDVEKTESKNKNTTKKHKEELEQIRDNLLINLSLIRKEYYENTGLGMKLLDTIFTSSKFKLIYKNNYETACKTALGLLKRTEDKIKSLPEEEKRELISLIEGIKDLANTSLDTEDIGAMVQTSIKSAPETGSLVSSYLKGMSIGLVEGAWKLIESVPDILISLGKLLAYVLSLAVDEKTREDLKKKFENIKQILSEMDSEKALIYVKQIKELLKNKLNEISQLPEEEQAKEIGKLFGQIEALLLTGKAVYKAGNVAVASGMNKTGKTLQIIGELVSIGRNEVKAGTKFLKNLRPGEKIFYTLKNGERGNGTFEGISRSGYHISIPGDQNIKLIGFPDAATEIFGARFERMISGLMNKNIILKKDDIIPNNIFKFFILEPKIPGGEKIVENLLEVLNKTGIFTKEQLNFVVNSVSKIQENFLRVLEASKNSAKNITDLVIDLRNSIKTFIKSETFSKLPKELLDSIKESIKQIKKKYEEILKKVTEKTMIKGENLTQKLRHKLSSTSFGDTVELKVGENTSYKMKKLGDSKFELEYTSDPKFKGLIGKEFELISNNGNIVLKNGDKSLALSKLEDVLIIKTQHIPEELFLKLKDKLGKSAEGLFYDKSVPEPRYYMNIDGRDFFFTGKMKSSSDRLYILGYTEIGGIYEPRLFYFSKSGGNWHCTPGVEATGRLSKAECLGASYEKGTIVSPEISNFFEKFETKQSVGDSLLSKFKEHVGFLNNRMFRENYGNEFKITDITEKHKYKYFHEIEGGANGKNIENIYKSIIIPDEFRAFSKIEKGKPQTHMHLGKVETYIGTTKYQGANVEIVFARAKNNKPGLLWIEDIRYTDTKINSYGIPEKTFNAGLLTTKPLEYDTQVPYKIILRGSEYGNYVDIRPYIQNNPLIEIGKNLISREFNINF